MIKHPESSSEQFHVCTFSKYLNSQDRSRDEKYPDIKSRISTMKIIFLYPFGLYIFYLHVIVKVNCIIWQYD